VIHRSTCSYKVRMLHVQAGCCLVRARVPAAHRQADLLLVVPLELLPTWTWCSHAWVLPRCYRA
jgi:hypothetical protein